MSDASNLSSFNRVVGWVSSVMPASMREALSRAPILAPWLRRRVASHASAGIVEVTVRAGLLRGLLFSVNLQTERAHWLGTYEPGLQAAVAELTRPGMVVYDVGAHVGYFTMAFARLTGPSGKVIAFDPLPENVERVRAQITLQKTVHADIRPCAVSDKSGEETLLLHESASMGQIRKPEEGGRAGFKGSMTVPTVSLDDFVYKHGHPAPDLIKMDIEGAEAKAIKGMQRLLREKGVIILLELHRGAEAETWQLLHEVGYFLFHLSSREKIESAGALSYGHYIARRNATKTYPARA